MWKNWLVEEWNLGLGCKESKESVFRRVTLLVW